MIFFDRLVVGCLILLIALAPLPLGSNRPASWSLLAVSVGGLTVAWGLVATFRPTLLRLGGRAALLPGALWALLAAWLLLQSTGPEFLWHPLWSETATALGRPVAGAIALAPFDAGTSAMRLLAYGGIFWIACQTGRDPRNATLYFAAVTAIGLVYALYGLAAEWLGGGQILWFEKWAYEDALTSTFVNRNNFATFAGLTMVAALTLALRGGAARHLSIAVLLVVGLAVLMTRSRGGLMATGAGLVAVIWAFYYRRRQVPGAPVLLGGLAVAVAVLLVAAGGGTFERNVAEDGAPLGGRPWLIRRTLAAIADAPLTGQGAGAFESYFQMYKNAEFGGVYAIGKAHNSYLEFAADAGLPALLVLLAVIGFIAFACFAGIRTRRQDAGFPAAGLAATVLVGLHALVDFSLQIPAVAALYALILGVGYAQAFPTGGGRHSRL